jgi:hypothetical protein
MPSSNHIYKETPRDRLAYLAQADESDDVCHGHSLSFSMSTVGGERPRQLPRLRSPRCALFSTNQSAAVRLLRGFAAGRQRLPYVAGDKLPLTGNPPVAVPVRPVSSARSPCAALFAARASAGTPLPSIGHMDAGWQRPHALFPSLSRSTAIYFQCEIAE